MAHVIVQHSIPSVTGLPADVVVNVFHFSTSLPVATTADYQACADAVKEFFDSPVTVGGNTSVIRSNILGALNAATGWTMKVYDRADPMPRPPRLVQTYNPSGPPAGTALPAECALVVSFRGAALAGTLPRRRRGRLYLGTLAGSGAYFGIATGDVRPFPIARDAVNAAAARLSGAASALPGGVIWSGYSRVDNVLFPVAAGFVDDALDTQRRRGRDATTRSTWSG